jgi:hypothetical protein
MKKGIILYVTNGKDEVNEWMDLSAEKKLLDVDDICLATSEIDVAYGWWRMLTRGMQHVSCMTANYDLSKDAIEPGKHLLKLCG